MSNGNRSLFSGFLRSVELFPERTALELGDEKLTYAQLWAEAARIAAAIEEHTAASAPLVALLAYRSVTAYAGILGILASGRGYVPLNPKFPTARTVAMLQASGCTTVTVGAECATSLPALLPLLDSPTTWLLSGSQSFPSEEIPAHHTAVLDSEMTHRAELLEPKPDPEAIAYLLFTSGSTGVPKGVAVSQANVRAYLDYVGARYRLQPEDRCSQNNDLTFDLSVHNVFTCWDAGAALCPIQEEVLVPATLIDDARLTVWISVPSLAMFAHKIGLLEPGAFPTLRLSLFCGEALSVSLAERWQQAAPFSVVENIYGPTETTVAITHYRWEGPESVARSVNGIVPIGTVFTGQAACVVDETLAPVAPGVPGELCLAGSQVTKGYLNNPEKTRSQFVRLPGKGEKTWYRTGDLVREDEAHCLHYLGRIDHQVKVNGYRIELQEIDLVLREVSGTELAVAIPWPLAEGTASGIVAVLSGANPALDQRIIECCSNRLPRYMVPSRIHHLDELPLNVNGKIDRNEITRRLATLTTPVAVG